MKVKNILIVILDLMMLFPAAYSQDKKTLETNVAELLSQFPAKDVPSTDKLMQEMISLGEKGLMMICDQIIPPGTGDDTKPRFGVESLSRFLSRKGMENDRVVWEDVLLKQISSKTDNQVKDFFMKQLHLIGGEKSVRALKSYALDKEICTSSVAAITAIGGKAAEDVLADLLRNKELPCAAAVMNGLAVMNSQVAVNEYISWASDNNSDIKASAYAALARSRSPLAYPVLLNAATESRFRWEPTGSVSALLTYAQFAGAYGDIETMDEICNLLIKECNDELTSQNKTAAQKIYKMYHGGGINEKEIPGAEYNLTPEEKSEGFVSLFNGRNLDSWTGDKTAYVVEDGMIVIRPDKGSGGNLYTNSEYSDFIFRFEFQLTPAANNGLGIRAPLQGDAAYVGMEIQILDNTAQEYATLQPYQYHGSVYGVIPAKRDYLNPVGEWNYEEVYAKGTKIRITLNGTVIVDGDIADARDNGTMDHRDHPGLKNTSGHIGFLGHGSVVRFRNIRVKDISDQ